MGYGKGHTFAEFISKLKHAWLFDLLSSLDIESHDIKLLSNLYWNQQSAVRHNGEVSESMNIKQGIRQGCVASPHLVALSAFTSLEKVLKSRDNKLQLRIRVLKYYVWSTLLYGSKHGHSLVI